MRKGEIQALGRMAAVSLARPSVVARDVHAAVTSRVFGLLGPLGVPIRPIHDAVSRASYRTVGATLRLPLNAAGLALARAAPPDSAALADSMGGALALGALNGIVGDRLTDDHRDLAFDLTVRRRGCDVSLSAEGLVQSFADATPKLAVFVHGLCETDDAWRISTGADRPHAGYGAQMHDELGYTPIYIRYNSGLHVSENGRRLAEVLDELVLGWPTPVEEIALIGHSMGGLVARSACHYGAAAEHVWTEGLRHVFCLGTPHLGAPLEQAANVAGWALKQLPETRPFGDLFFNGRSAGIKDLRFGSCIEEDWRGCDPDEFLRDRCREVPFLPSAAYYFVGATLTSGSDGIGGMIGDLLVQYPSASGNGRRRRIPFEIDNGRHVGGTNHFQLLNHPAVYGQIRDWINRGPRIRQA